MNHRTFFTQRTALLLGLLWSVTGHGFAQDYQRYAPQVPPNSSTPATLPNNLAPVQGSDEELGPDLKGVVFVDAPGKVSSQVLHSTGIITNGIAMLQSPDFAKVVQPYIGKAISLRRMNELIQGIIVYYREHDRPVVDISIPEQDLTGGVVQFLVIEGRVGKVEAKGNRWFSNALIINGIRAKPGSPISSNLLLDDLDTLDQNPFRSSTALLVAGSTPGSTDIVIQTKDRFPLRAYVGYEDNGNALTGYDRWNAGFNWGNAFGLGQQLNYQFTTSSNFDSLVANSASYVIPMPWRDTLILYGAISSSRVIENGFVFQGAGSQVGLRYEIPLPTIRGGSPDASVTYDQSIYAGYDWKQSDNFIEFGIIPVNNAIADVGQIVLGYRSTLIDPWGTLSFNPEIDISPAEVWSFQNNADYAAVRSGAQAEYAYFKGTLSQVTRLPGDFSLVNELRGQVASTNLLPSEQLVLGGDASIRGYNDQDISDTDDGIISRNEVRTPPISIAHLFMPQMQSGVTDQLQFLGFFDYGLVWAHQGSLTLNNGKSVNNAEFEGVGPGIRYTIGDYLSLRADYGFQLHDTGDTDGSRWHIALTLSY